MIEKADSALVEDVLKGSHEAFTPLVLRHQNRVYATAVAVLSDFALAEDVVQDALLAYMMFLPVRISCPGCVRRR